MSRRYLGGFITANPVTPTSSAASGAWTLNQQLQARAANNWPLPFGDPYFNYTSMLLSTTALSNANNNLFVDSSGAFNPISRTGNTTQGSFAPYGTYWSNYSDNSGDYLTAGSGSSAFAFGTGNFTIEGWFYSNASVANWKPMLSVGAAAQGQLIRINQGLQFTGNWGMLYPNDAGNADVYFDTGSPFPLNQWVHVALVRNGTTLTLYQNGVNVLQKTVGFNFTNTTGVAIGYGQYPADGVFGGYMSNIRIVKGTAVYTANFTPPTTPLTAISGTSLLTCQSNRFRDASSNNFAVTPAGDIRVTDFSPFLHTAPIQYNQSDITNWSGYFDGSGDYLSVPNSTSLDFGTGDFTLEGWVYFTSLSGRNALFGSNAVGGFDLQLSTPTNLISLGRSDVAYDFNSSFTFVTGQWYHVAITRASGTARCFVNGALINSASNSVSYSQAGGQTLIGASVSGGTIYHAITGYISNVRAVKGTAVYTSAFTPPTSPLTAISGTSLLTLQNAAFTDNSTNNFVITPNGNVTVTGNSPFNTVGYWSNYFDGTGDYLDIASNSAFDLSGDFTWEFWVNTTRTADSWLTGYYVSNPGFTSQVGPIVYIFSGSYFLSLSSGSSTETQFLIGSASSISNGAWHHIACTRSGNTVRTFLDGTLVTTTSYSLTVNNPAGAVYRIGGLSGTFEDPFAGYISNLRLVKGTALYISSFTPPTQPLTAISGTSLLTCQNARLIDNSSNNFTITRNGDVSVQSFDPFYTATIASNGGSMYFDGSADYIEPSWSSTSLPGSWTFECWFYATAASGMIFDCRPNSTNGYYPSVSIASSTQIDFYYNANSNLITVPGGTINKWIHLAVVKNGTSLVVYLDGVSSFSATDSNTWAIGASRPRIGANGGYYSAAPAPLTGYISNFRILNGTAAYTGAFTPPTAPTSPTPNTILMLNGMNAGAFDATATNDMETVGSVRVTTAVSKFGGSSIAFDGTTSYLGSNSATTDLYAFGTGDFTVEFWVYLNNTSTAVIYDPRPTGTNGQYPMIYTDGGTFVFFVSSGVRIVSSAFAVSTWHHVAVSRSGTSTKMFVNGTQAGSTYTDTNNYLCAAGRPYIGINATGLTVPFNGYIDDLRVTKGYARYTANFTPPTAALPTY